MDAGRLIERLRERADTLTPEQRAEMRRQYLEDWAQWAEDYREGRCSKD